MYFKYIFFWKGEIIVTDTDNKALKVISASGQQIYKLEAEFACPVGVAVDSNDNIIVSDWNDRISVSSTAVIFLPSSLGAALWDCSKTTLRASNPTANLSTTTVR